MNYEQMVNQIKLLIDSKMYENALSMIDMILNYEGADVKELVNLKASILIVLNRAKEALELYQGTILYDKMSLKEQVAFLNLAEIHKQLGHTLMSEAMAFQARHLKEESSADALDRETVLAKEVGLLQNKVLAGDTAPETYYALAYQHLLQLQVVEACIYYRKFQVEKEKKEVSTDSEQVVEDEVYSMIGQYRYAIRFYEQLKNPEHTYCLIVQEEDEAQKQKFKILASILRELGKEVYKILPSHQVLQGEDAPITAPSERDIQTVLLDLYEQYCKEDSWIVLGDSQQVETLMTHIPLFKVTQKAYGEGRACTYPTLSAFYMGNYLHTAKYLYGFDVPTQMSKTPEVKISIVVPTKHCSYTLRNTLKTCLEQRFLDYEVVVSDNSEADYQDTYNLVQALNNDKIKYYKVPYPLSLAKSFEYAYLRARGEFIFSIGADDAVLPYALAYMSDVLDEHPNENVLLWQRLFYVWPELKATGQADQFTFPIHLTRHKPSTTYISSVRHMNYVTDLMNERVTGIYGLPMMYINSGMRRRHILEMIKQTGKFLDGTSQDIYTGITTLALYDVVLHIDYPLTIAGMCSNSVGASTITKSKGVEKYKQFVEEYNKCTFFTDIPGTPSQARLFPQYDYLLFIYELLKVYDLDINPKCKEWAEKINFKTLLEWSIGQFDYNGHICLDFIEIARTCAHNLGEETSNWFETFIKPYEAKPRIVQFMTHFGDNMPKHYAKGVSGESLTIDSAELGIKNIYEVTQFFVHLLNL